MVVDHREKLRDALRRLYYFHLMCLKCVTILNANMTRILSRIIKDDISQSSKDISVALRISVYLLIAR